jgi:insertion element IS1 protein InsB
MRTGYTSIGRILKISASSVVRHIKIIAGKYIAPPIREANEICEIDEIQTYVGKKIPANYTWITYAINRRTKAVINFIVGKRTKENLKTVTNKVLALQPKCIYTNGLPIYCSLIDKAIHKVQRFKINHIERKNLTLRTHLKD